MNKFICMSVSLSMSMSFRKWCTFKLQFIFVLFMLGGYNSYGWFLEGCTVDHCDVRPEYSFGIQASRNKFFLYNIGFW